MIFKQLFEPLSCTYSYLLADKLTGRAILIDPVISTLHRDLSILAELNLTLACTIDTHIHADHITSALELKKQTGSKIATPAFDRLTCTDIAIEEGIPFVMDGITIQPLHTPGHTDGHFAYLYNDRIFTGDALLIEGCGRTDFQNGSADTLYRSVNDKIFTLPNETLIYPAHDYKERFVSSVGQEKKKNPRLGNNKTLEEFREIMANLNLPYPKFIDYAVSGNRSCGVCPEKLPDHLAGYCNQSTESIQG